MGSMQVHHSVTGHRFDAPISTLEVSMWLPSPLRNDASLEAVPVTPQKKSASVGYRCMAQLPNLPFDETDYQANILARVLALKPEIKPKNHLTYENLVFLARARMKIEDNFSNPTLDRIAIWCVDYLLTQAITVNGQDDLAEYIGNPEAARKAALPKAYELIAVLYPDLAPYCKQDYRWQWVLDRCNGIPEPEPS